MFYCVFSFNQFACGACVQEDIAGEIEVLPVFFMPKDQRKPTRTEMRRLQRHLVWAQERYREMLNNQSTFRVAEQPEIYEAKQPLVFYKNAEKHNPVIADELLAWKKTDRFDCKLIFFTIVMNTEDKFPGGSGTPFNGGFNTGGGVASIGLYMLNEQPNFQSTVQHELGHSFGLNHVKAYGYDMKKNDSIMSYNPLHHTRKFKASRNPGKLIPEDLRGLCLNDKVFPNLEFCLLYTSPSPRD